MTSFIGCLGLVAAMIVGFTQTAEAQELGPPHPIPPLMVKFVQSQFASIPAPTLVEAASGATCRTMEFGQQADMPYVGLEACELGTVCPDLSFPVWFDGKGKLGFGPDSAGRLVAESCPETISDPLRRSQLVDALNAGG